MNPKEQTTLNARIDFYKSLSIVHRNLIDSYKKQLSVNSILRLLAVIVGASGVYYLWKQPIVAISIAIVFVILFAYLLKRHNRLQRLKSLSEAKLKIAEDELKAFDFDFSAFDGAQQYINPSHDFSFDLDVFGERSLFQQINRTSLSIGKESLAHLFQFPMRKRSEIEQRQQAVRELADKEDFGLEFRAIGLSSDDTIASNTDAKKLFQDVEKIRNPKFWKTTTIAIPIFYLIYFVLLSFGIVSGFWFVSIYLATLALSFIPTKQITTIWHIFEKRTKILNTYSQLFRLIEQQTFESEELKQLQQQILKPDTASSAISRLIYYCRNLNQSFVFPVLLIVNPFFMWNVRYALKIESWMQKYAGETDKWFPALAKMDALISLGTFTANRPDYNFPEFSDTFLLEGTQLGHPLIPRDKCVKNDIHISRKPFFMIVTGANMAGKSTYLRAVGVNHLFASMGLPVYAEKIRFYPGKLLTNLRTADSLVNNESYFFAELKRLKMIIDELTSGVDGLFIILDEILKGTNSEDKQKGSLMLMKRLIELGGNGIIATHDLALGELEHEFPTEIKNFHFDATISNDTLSFDYLLHAGIAKNMNASFLMRKMGITE